METVEPHVKKGFVDLVFSIYENLPSAACDALEQMGVLRPGIDRFSIERIATNMLDTFQSTLASGPEAKWENQMSPEEKFAARRKRRAELGQDLFSTQAERPFLFPPKFTFVFRAFSTIDGIGKGLEGKAYDLGRISQPYLRQLADLRDGSVATSAIKQVGQRLGLRPVDIAETVQQPRIVSELRRSMDRIETVCRASCARTAAHTHPTQSHTRMIADMVSMLTIACSCCIRACRDMREPTCRGGLAARYTPDMRPRAASYPSQGKLKLRVRTLEVERMVEKVQLQHRLTTTSVGALALYQLLRDASGRRWLQAPLGVGLLRLVWALCAATLRLRQFEEQRKRFMNEGASKYDADDVF